MVKIKRKLNFNPQEIHSLITTEVEENSILSPISICITTTTKEGAVNKSLDTTTEITKINNKRFFKIDSKGQKPSTDLGRTVD